MTSLLVLLVATPASAADEVVTVPGKTLRAKQSASFAIEGPAGRVTVHARGCRTPATLRARLDGGPVTRVRVGRAWGVRRLATVVPAGRHRLSLAVSGVTCRRGVEVARVSWRRAVAEKLVPTTPPAPAPSAPAPAPAPVATPAPAPAPAPPLGPPVPLGAAASWPHLEQPGPYRAALLEHFASITPENEMKMERLQPNPTAFDFTAADALLEFAEEHELPVRGHTLVWGEQLPWWVLRLPFDRLTLIEVMKSHIRTVMERYRGRISEWDVVNESIADDGRWRPNRWLELIGPEYVEIAFRTAHEVDPDARLYYNDFAAEAPGAKQDGIVAMLKWLVEDGVPVHGVGMQMHTTADGAPTEDQVRDAMRRYEALGLEVQITEMDVAATGDPATAAARQAAVYARTARACRSVPACKRLTVWGVGDAFSWTPQAQALLLDSTLTPKPALTAIHAALNDDE